MISIFFPIKKLIFIGIFVLPLVGFLLARNLALVFICLELFILSVNEETVFSCSVSHFAL